MNLMVNLLIDGLRHQFQQVPDPRSGGNTLFSFDDIGKPIVTFCCLSRFNSASPTNTTTDFTGRLGNPIPARASSIALTCP